MTRDSVTWDAATEQEIAAVLVGRLVQPGRPDTFAYMAARHHVAPLLVRAGASALLPPDLAERLVAETRRQVVLAAVRDRELARVLRVLHEHGVETLLLKGAHLAHTHYPCSYLRVRSDTDLLIRPASVRRAAAALGQIGYQRQSVQTGAVVLGQMMFDRTDMPGAALDVHWQAAAPRVAARLIAFDDLLGRAVRVPALGPHALAPCGSDALAIACLHQVAHHQGHDVLLWMYDVHLLLQSLDDLEIDQFVHRAAERGMARICQAVIANAAARFPSQRAADVVEKLGAAADVEPAAALIDPRSPLDDLRLNLAVPAPWMARLRLVAGHLFPPAAYMRATYAPGSRAPLPVLYVTRIVRGAPRWLRRATDD